MEPLPGMLHPGSSYTYIPDMNEHRHAPLWGYPCSCPRYLWDNFAKELASSYLDPYILWSQQERRGYEVYTMHWFECPVGAPWIARRLNPLPVYDHLGSDWYHTKFEDETLATGGKEQLLELKRNHELRRESSQVKRTRNRRENVGSHNWYRAWNTMPGSVQPKLSRREQEALEGSSSYATKNTMTSLLWEGCEDKGNRRTAARPRYWKRRNGCCVSCSYLETSLFKSCKWTQKADLQKLVQRYQAASNAKARTKVANHGGATCKGPSWADYAWELATEDLDWEVYWPGVGDTETPMPLPSTQEVDLVHIVKPRKYIKKHGMPREFPSELFRSPAISALSSDWDDISVASVEDFVMV